jgi:hypothetical protein
VRQNEELDEWKYLASWYSCGSIDKDVVEEALHEQSKRVKLLIAALKSERERLKIATTALEQYKRPFGNQWVDGVRQFMFFGDYHAAARNALQKIRGDIK